MSCELIDAAELARRWNVPKSWISDGVRSRTLPEERIPHVRFGRYVRFEWGCEQLEAWIAKRRCCKRKN